jgi:hypothetical protein
MAGFNYDANKMLGKLSKRTLKRGCGMLKELVSAVSGVMEMLSNQYFSRIMTFSGWSRSGERD